MYSFLATISFQQKCNLFPFIFWNPKTWFAFIKACAGSHNAPWLKTYISAYFCTYKYIKVAYFRTRRLYRCISGTGYVIFRSVCWRSYQPTAKDPNAYDNFSISLYTTIVGFILCLLASLPPKSSNAPLCTHSCS